MSTSNKKHATQRKDGRYQCKYQDQVFYGRTEADALAARVTYLKTPVRPPSPTISQYASKWLKAYKSHLTPGPYNTHIRNLNKFIDLVEDKPLSDVMPSDIALFYQQYAGMSTSSIHSARDTIKGLFKAALADGIITKDPTTVVAVPKGTKGTHRAITPEERELIHQTQHRMRPGALLMLYAGLRRGEVLALDIDRDIDFDALTITIRQAVRFVDSKPVLVAPKTEAGIRVIPLMNGLKNELIGLHGLVCTTHDGRLMTQSAWERAWESYLYALGVTKNHSPRRKSDRSWSPVNIRAHDLRHSYCTMLYDMGIDLKTAMLWMGHADQTMTMQIYTHLSEQRLLDSQKALLEANDTLFGCQNGCQNFSKSA